MAGANVGFMWNSIKALRWTQLVTLVIWLPAMIGVFLLEPPSATALLVLQVIAMAAFFTAFWRAMWLQSEPRRDHSAS